MVKAVQEGAPKMDFEPPSRIMKLAGTARYSSRVFMAWAGVPDESVSVTIGRSRVVTRFIFRLSFFERRIFYFQKKNK